ncbi:hypothetical protein VYU27_007962 [Nannochloropsis oceanica]
MDRASSSSTSTVMVDPMWPCYACRASRTKCTGGFPCSRCARLSVCCLPNNWRREEPILEYVLTVHSPKPFAEMYTVAFERLFLAGKIRRHSALRILKMWDFLSCLAEADVTLGVAEHIRRRFDISPTELEEPMRMLEDPPPHVRMQRLRQYQGSEAKRARTQQLKELEVFKRADAGSDVTNTSVLMFVTTESTMWAACNDIHANRLKEATELWDKALQRKLTWAYLMAPIYAPEDRQTYFESLVEMTFGHTVMTKTEIFKMYDIDGTTKLCLNTAKSMLLGPNRMGLIFKVEIAPPSRHLTLATGSSRVAGRVRSTWAKDRNQKMVWEGIFCKGEEGMGRGKDRSVSRWENNVTGWSEPGVGRVGSSSRNNSNNSGSIQFRLPGIATVPFAGAASIHPPLPLDSHLDATEGQASRGREEGEAAPAGNLTPNPPRSCPNSFLVRAAAMPAAELEAIFSQRNIVMRKAGHWERAYTTKRVLEKGRRKTASPPPTPSPPTTTTPREQGLQGQNQPLHQRHEERDAVSVTSADLSLSALLSNDGMLLCDVFAPEGSDGRGVGEREEEGGKENGKEEVKETVMKAYGQENLAPLPTPGNVAHMNCLMREVPLQHFLWPQSQQLEYHDHACQPTASVFPPRESGDEGRDGEGGCIGYVAHSPSSLPVLSPAFREQIPQELLAKGEGGECGDDAVQRSPGVGGGVSFMENEKEVMYLFKDGDLDSW